MFAAVFGGCRSERSEAVDAINEPDVLDYDKMIVLDAEDLAEGGMAEAYAKLLRTCARWEWNQPR